MRCIFLALLLSLPLFLAPVLASGADAKPKAAEADQPSGGAKAHPKPAAAQAPADAKADTDADKPDADKADSDAADADADIPKPPKTGSRPTSLAIIPEPGGLKTLTIHFRWSLYPAASIEVRLVSGPRPKGSTVEPVKFSRYLKGKVRDDLYTCLDHPRDAGGIESFTKNEIVYKMIGGRNSLGNQGVHVQVQPEKSNAPDASSAAVYLQLDTWAVDRETLSLDLAKDEFAKSGRLYIWFFRGDQIVWEEQIRWPGYK